MRSSAAGRARGQSRRSSSGRSWSNGRPPCEPNLPLHRLGGPARRRRDHLKIAICASVCILCMTRRKMQTFYLALLVLESSQPWP